MSVLFTIYDYIFFAFILLFSLVGVMRGFWIQLFALLVWLLSLAIYCMYTSTWEEGFLSAYMTPEVAHWFVLTAILVGACIVNFIIRFLLTSIFTVNPFTFFNKIGGLLLGAAASSTIVVLVVYAIDVSSFSSESSEWKNSFVDKQLAPVFVYFKAHMDHKAQFNHVTTADSPVSQIANTTEVG